MKDLLKHRIFGSNFIRNAATLATGTVIAQLITISMAPVLYRIYDKEDYGTLGQYLALVGVINVFSTMQYLQVILIEKSDENAKNLMWFTRSINIVVTFLLFCLVYFFNRTIANLLNNSELSTWLYLLPVSVFFTGQNDIFRVWANRKKKYKLMTFNAILTAALVPLVSLSIGLLHEGEEGLFAGLITGQIIPPLVLLIALSRKDDLGFKYFNPVSMLEAAKRYRSFPLYNMPSEFINRFSNQLPVFMLSSYFGAGVVGIYNLCTRMLGLPVQLVGSAVAEVFKQKASSDYNREGKFDQIFTKTLKALSLLSIVPFIIILLFAPFLFENVFGEEWRESGEFARTLGIMFVFRFIASPLSFSFIITGRLREDMIYHIWMLISNLLIFVLGFENLDDYKTVLLMFAFNNSLIYLLYIIRSYCFSKMNNNVFK